MPLPRLSVLAPEALRPGPDQARSWTDRELGRPEYHQGLVTRFLAWVHGLWDSLTASAAGASPLSTAAAVVALAVLVALVLLVVGRVRREPGRDREDGPLLVPGQVPPDEHRRSAELALRDGAFDTAVVEAFRALAARSVRRGLVRERPGLTAHELSVDLGPVFPDQAAALEEASTLFDRAFYGDRPATGADARTVLDLDEALRPARPQRVPGDAHGPTAPAPR